MTFIRAGLENLSYVVFSPRMSSSNVKAVRYTGVLAGDLDARTWRDTTLAHERTSDVEPVMSCEEPAFWEENHTKPQRSRLPCLLHVASLLIGMCAPCAAFFFWILPKS